MKIVNLLVSGIKTAKPAIMKGASGEYLCFTHGHEGRGRWQYRIPLSARDFPVPEYQYAISYSYGLCYINIGDNDYKLVPLNKRDRMNNELFLAVKGENDGKYLVFWHLSPGYRGGARYNIEGSAKLLALGKEAQGAAGRMGGADCPVLLVEGPCKLTWTRTGRLYGSPPDWVAQFDGESWSVLPKDECELELAAFSW